MGALYVHTGDDTVKFFQAVGTDVFYLSQPDLAMTTIQLGELQNCAAVSPVVGNEVCIANAQGCRIYNVNTGRPVTDTFADSSPVRRLAMSKTDQGLVVAAHTSNGDLQLWRAQREGALHYVDVRENANESKAQVADPRGVYYTAALPQPSGGAAGSPSYMPFKSIDEALTALRLVPEKDTVLLVIFDVRVDPAQLARGLKAAPCRHIFVVTDTNLELPEVNNAGGGGASPTVRRVLFPNRLSGELVSGMLLEMLVSSAGPLDGSHLTEQIKAKFGKEADQWTYTTWPAAGHNGLAADVYLPLPNRGAVEAPSKKSVEDSVGGNQAEQRPPSKNGFPKNEKKTDK